MNSEQVEITVKGLTITKYDDIEMVFIIEKKDDDDIITTSGHRIGWDWNSNLGCVVWNPKGRRIMHSVSIV
jgi:hypothetical protein